MVSTVSAAPSTVTLDRRDGISLARLLWVAPLALVVAVAVNYAIKLLVQALNPALQRMGQLQEPMLILTIEGVIAAVVVFVVFALVVPRPIFWYRAVGVVALLVSLLPDLALLMGGQPMFMTMRTVGTLTSIGMGPPPGGPPPGGPGGGGPPPGGGGFNFTMPMNQVLILMLLHVATAIVCIVLLTTLTRRRQTFAAD
jgi:hypothetical protein